MKKGQDIKVTFRVHEMSKKLWDHKGRAYHVRLECSGLWIILSLKFQLYFILVNNVKKSDSPKERRRKKRKRSREPCCIRLVMII